MTTLMRMTLGAALLLAPALAFAAEGTALPPLHVYKSASCSCCGGWVAYMKKQGFDVTVTEQDDLTDLKAKLHVPETMQSCHTATIGDYVVEGHVPAADIERLLKEKPDAVGLAAAGMPQAAPGMDTPGSTEPYDVVLIKKDGTSTVFAHHTVKQ